MSSPLKILVVVTAALVSVASVFIIKDALDDSSRRARRLAKATHYAAVAQEALAAGEPAVAVQAYSAAVQGDPASSDLRIGLASAQIERILNERGWLNAGNARALEVELRVAARLGSEGARLEMALGRLHQVRGRLDAARARYEKAVGQAPDDALAHLLLGDAELKAGRLDQAEPPLRRSLELDAKSEQAQLARFALGQVLLAKEQYDAALPLLQAASRALTDNARLQLALGRVYHHKELWAAAVGSLERAVALDANLNAAYRLLGESYLRTNKIDAALGALKAAWQRGADKEALRGYGRVLFQLERWADVVNVFGLLRTMEPDDAEAHCRLAAAADALGDLESALPLYRRCNDLAVKQPDMKQSAELSKKRLETLEAGLERAKKQGGR